MAAQRLAELADFYRFGLKEDAVDDLLDADIEAQLDAASEVAISYLAARGYAPPFVTWGDDLRSAVCKIAAWDVLVHMRGIDPTTGAHLGIQIGRDQALQWLRDIAKGLLNLSVVSTAPARAAQGIISVIQPLNDDGTTTRGW